MPTFKKIIIPLFSFVILFSVFTSLVKADSDQELRDFLETLITIGVIPPAKADLARTVLNSALSNSSTRINRDLKEGSTGDDVKLLQKVLNTNPSTVVAASGSGSAGNETTYFGPATKAAVIKFQNYYNIGATGEVDEATRAKINAILSVITNVNIPEADRPSVDLKVNGQDDNVQVGYGGTVTLIWTSKNVTSCVSGANNVKPVFGTDSLTNVVSSGEFMLTCVGPKGIVSDSVVMNVISNNNPNSNINNGNLVTLGSGGLNNTTDNFTTGVRVYVNGQTNYTINTTSDSVSNITPTISWVSNGFSTCKATSNPTITGLSNVLVPTSGSANINSFSASLGTITFTVACATGTAVTTLNQNPVTSLSQSTDLVISSATLNIQNSSSVSANTTGKSLNIYVNNQKNYSTTTDPMLFSYIHPSISWTSSGFSACKVTSNPIVANFYETSVATNGNLLASVYPSMNLGTTTFSIACATGTAVNTLNLGLVSSLLASDNLMIATSTLYLSSASSTMATTTVEEPGVRISFGGQIKSVTQCYTDSGTLHTRFKEVVVAPCVASGGTSGYSVVGDAYNVDATGNKIGTLNGSKYGVGSQSPVKFLWDSVDGNPLPQVGQSILGTASPKGDAFGEKCPRTSPTGSSGASTGATDGGWLGEYEVGSGQGCSSNAATNNGSSNGGNNWIVGNNGILGIGSNKAQMYGGYFQLNYGGGDNGYGVNLWGNTLVLNTNGTQRILGLKVDLW